MKNAKVEVLVSTYNGEGYIAQQMESLISQSYDDILISVRDDGSSDRTLELLSEFKASEKVSSVKAGDNLGVVGSFFNLLYSVSSESEFVAFCDQDDVWHKDKLQVAVATLKAKGSGKAAMYCCRTRLVNSELQEIGYGRVPRRPLALENALLQNVATGCTIVLNRRAVDLLVSKRPNLQSILMHDYWFYLVLSALGDIFFDESAYIDYRQHDGNVVGSKRGLSLFLMRLRRFSKGNLRSLSGQAREFLCLYGTDLSEDQISLVNSFIEASTSESWFRRLSLATRLRTYRQSSMDTFLSFLMMVLGKYK